MSRCIHVLNLVGVMALAAVCVLQWRENRSLNQTTNRLETVRQEQSSRLAEQEKILKGQAADLDSFRSQLERGHVELKEMEKKEATQERRNQELTQENEALKRNIAEWAAAVRARDEKIREANDRLASLSERADEAVKKFNQLATDYNEVVRQLNEARAPVSSPPKP